MRTRAAVLLPVACLLTPPIAGLPGAALAAGAEARWRAVPLPGNPDALTALAAAEGDRLAVGDARAAWLRDGGGARVRGLRRGAVRDLLFRPGGVLWVATEDGLFRLGPDGEVRDRSPAPGAAARSVRRLAARDRLLAAATDAGVHLWDGEAWRSLGPGLPRAGTEALLWQPGDDGAPELWIAHEGELLRARIRPESAAVVGLARERLPAAAARAPVADLVDLGDGVVVAVGGDWLAVRHAGRWRVVRPSLPPGARARRLVAFDGALWLATDGGLLRAADPEASWQRAAAPAGRLATADLAVAGDVLYAATESGLLATAPRAAGEGAGSTPLPPRLRVGAAEPGVRAVQRAALAYLELGPSRLRDLRRRVDRRALLPEVELRGTSAQAKRTDEDFDQTFTSGADRRFRDYERSRAEDFAVTLSLTWDLGDAVYHPEALDVSREAREVIELRDEILDEVTQLFFERRRVLLALASVGPEAGAENLRLRLRADELAAGLDAWTGGWFGRHAPPLSP